MKRRVRRLTADDAAKPFYCCRFEDWSTHKVGTHAPYVQHRDFDTREAAEAFRAELKRTRGSECVSTIAEIGNAHGPHGTPQRRTP